MKEMFPNKVGGITLQPIYVSVGLLFPCALLFTRPVQEAVHIPGFGAIVGLVLGFPAGFMATGNLTVDLIIGGYEALSILVQSKI